MIRNIASKILCAATFAAPLAAQGSRITLDGSVGAKSGAQRAAVSAWYPAVLLARRLHLGVGVRLSVYAGAPIGYSNRGTIQGSRPPNLTIDPAVYALNGAVFGELRVLHSVDLGANLDLVGIATGPTRTVGALTAKPQAGSYFQYGSADHGALNSEFFFSLRVAEPVQLRVGISHYVTDYTVTDTGTSGGPSTRYQRFQTAPFAAIRVRL